MNKGTPTGSDSLHFDYTGKAENELGNRWLESLAKEHGKHVARTRRYAAEVQYLCGNRGATALNPAPRG